MILVGFLRGINVGGHHKVPMAELRDKLSEIGCQNVKTLLNSGNVIFESEVTTIQKLQLEFENHLSKSFNFAIPVILRTKVEIDNLLHIDPFKGIIVHKDIRLYVSFLKDEPKTKITIPYCSKDDAFQIISVNNRIICSVLDVSSTQTPKAMEELEKLFGKNLTTRNWNTILKIVAS